MNGSIHTSNASSKTVDKIDLEKIKDTIDENIIYDYKEDPENPLVRDLDKLPQLII